MRHGRSKLARKTLQFYRIHAPHLLLASSSTGDGYGQQGGGGGGHGDHGGGGGGGGGNKFIRVILDGTFLVASVRNKVPLYERLSKTLQHEEFSCYVTRSTLVELDLMSTAMNKKSGDINDDTNDFAKARHFGLNECDIIEPNDVPSSSSSSWSLRLSTGDDHKAKKDVEDDDDAEFSEAMRDVHNLATLNGTNELGYFVATNDDVLSAALRSAPFVPQFRLARGVLLFESPSASSRRFAERSERDKRGGVGSSSMSVGEKEVVEAVRKEEGEKRREEREEGRKKAERKAIFEHGVTGFGNNGRRRKKKGGNPNPLSCKKRKLA